MMNSPGKQTKNVSTILPHHLQYQGVLVESCLMSQGVAPVGKKKIP